MTWAMDLIVVRNKHSALCDFFLDIFCNIIGNRCHMRTILADLEHLSSRGLFPHAVHRVHLKVLLALIEAVYSLTLPAGYLC